MLADVVSAWGRGKVCQPQGFCNNRSALFLVDTVSSLHGNSMVTCSYPSCGSKCKYQVSVSVSLPFQVFRTDLITAMKLHDSYQLNPDEYYVLADPWRQEWEKGVQVPVSPGTIPQPVAR